MKFWQILACLSQQKNIIDKYFPDYELGRGNDDIDEKTLVAALKESKELYYLIDFNGQILLRLMPIRKDILEGEISILEKEIPIIQAYLRFGGDAITEVVDYGSAEINKL